MTMPKGFGTKDFDEEDIMEKRTKYNPRPKKKKTEIKFVKSNYCYDCGHLKIVHEGFFTKGKCNVCMCPRFMNKMVRMEK